MKYPGFCGESYTSQSRLASCARSVNFYPEVLQTDSAKARVVLYPTPGLRQLVRGTTGFTGRALWAQTGRCFVIFGPQFQEVFKASDGTFSLTLRGTVITDANPATMTTNGDGGHQLAITSGDKLYIYNLTTNTLVGPVITGAQQVVYLSTRFITLDVKTSQMKISNQYDGLVWDPTQMTLRGDASDPWKALAVSSQKELWLLGERTGTIYYDAGASPFPFLPRQGQLITPGIAAPFSLKEVNGSMIWLASGDPGAGSVVRARGYSPETISTEAVKYAISRYMRESRIDDAVAFTYEQQGHHFYELNFPTAKATWVFDESTNFWHERGSYDGSRGTFDAWGPQYYAHEFGQNLVADHKDAVLYEMGIDYYSDVGGGPLTRMRIAPGLVMEQKRMYYDEFRLYLECGVANQTGLGSNPQVSLRLSNDGGKTWGSEWWRGSGKIGEFNPPYVDWFKLGSATDRVFAVLMSDPTPWRIVDAYLTVREGR